MEPRIVVVEDDNRDATWPGDQPGRDGNTYNITFKLKADGTKLTGTMGGDQSSSQ